jgi:DNA-binding transcriptional ArsR family regulator
MELTLLYKCLADQTRLQILNLLKEGPLCGCHFMEVLGLPQVKVSKQLNYMHSLGVLAKVREANWMIYSLAEPVHPVLVKNLEAYSVENPFLEDSKRLTLLKEQFTCNGSDSSQTNVPSAVATGCCSLPNYVDEAGQSTQPCKEEVIIPLISSGTKGPLGVMHLPRLWLKALLSAVGRLPQGCKDIRPGFDYMVLEGIGVNPDDARDFIKENLPTYLDFEKWIVTQPEVDLSAANIDRVNQIVVERKKADASRKKLLDSLGLDDDGFILDSLTLNDLDDWRSIHEQLCQGE